METRNPQRVTRSWASTATVRCCCCANLFFFFCSASRRIDHARAIKFGKIWQPEWTRAGIPHGTEINEHAHWWHCDRDRWCRTVLVIEIHRRRNLTKVLTFMFTALCYCSGNRIIHLKTKEKFLKRTKKLVFCSRSLLFPPREETDESTRNVGSVCYQET